MPSLEKAKRKRDDVAPDKNSDGVAKRLAEQKDVEPSYGVNLIEVDGKSCTHEVAWPEGVDGSSLPPKGRDGPPAKEYPFTIDPFQQTAINCLEAGHSVLVAAHTSAGKTVVAEYAFAMALRDKQRVVYTSPLKALSNQKYREFYEQFQDVGLMTGDVTINPTASCLVMTTEILRSMLYRGAEVVREVQLVVYDEIHYLRDKERGVVWEESIILAPKTARFAFLSATIPNAAEFAQWIATVHRSPCHVVYTEYRPTPLQHYMFPSGSEGLFMVVDERGAFREDNFQKAMAVVADATVDNKTTKGNKEVKATNQGEKSDIYNIVRMIMERNYHPVIIFSFSKKECEALALQMSTFDLNDTDEKKMVDTIFWSALDCLSEDDKRLPQITNALPMLKRGIGVHHSGLLPLLKEVIEILFQEGLIKALFATETFSTGLNMPAKTVVFTHARKFDGGTYRWISSGEYIQMSGRAGRRGLDDRGIVILMVDGKMEPSTAKNMVKGAPDLMYSEFHLSYSMLLNLMRGDTADPETIMKSSFRQFQTERALPSLQHKMQQLQERHDGMDIPEESSLRQYVLLRQQLHEFQSGLRSLLHSPDHCLPFLQPGRLVRVMQQNKQRRGDDEACTITDFNFDQKELATPGVWGVIINFERIGSHQTASANGKAEQHSKKKKAGGSYIVDVLLSCQGNGPGGEGGPKIPTFQDAGKGRGTAMVVALPLSAVDTFSSVRIYIPKDLRQQEARTLAVKTLGEVQKRFPKGIPLLDPQEDMKIKDEKLRKLQRKIEGVEGAVESHPLHNDERLSDLLDQLKNKESLGSQIVVLQREVKDAQRLVMRDELKARRRVLRRLGYVDDSGVVTLKGRAAAELQSGDELVLCEMLFNGVLNDLNINQLAALLSAFIWREKTEGGGKVRDELQGVYGALRDTARRVGKVALECKMPMDVDEYVDSFRADLMEVVAAWARGAKFAEVLKISNVFEGSIVRAVRREEELLRQLVAAAKVIGETALAEKFEEAITRMKRDIIFAASLYL